MVSLPQMDQVEKGIEERLKDFWRMGTKTCPTLDRRTKVWWDPLTWELKDGTVTARFHAHYKSNDPSDRPKKDLELSSIFNWDKNLSLENIGFKIGAADRALGTMLQDDLKGTDKDLNGILNCQTRVNDAWDKLREPIKLDRNIWLQIQPESISLGPSRLRGLPNSPRIETTVELTARPKVVFGDEPPALKAKLPPFAPYQPGPDRFRAESNLRISFEEVTRILTDPRTGLMDRPLDKNGDHDLRITGIRAYGSGGKMVVEAKIQYSPLLNLSGKPAKLTIYLIGTPRYRAKTRTIDFPDLDFDIKTSDFLVQVADFVVGSNMTTQIRRQAVIRIGKKLKDLKQRLSDILNRPLGKNVRLETKLQSLKMEDVFVSGNGLEGRVVLEGRTIVKVDW